MKVAFTTSGDTMNSPLDARFGRAEKFIVYDMEKEVFEVISNERNLNAAQGAGIQAAETIVRSGAECLVTGHCGPKAFRVLSTSGIKIFNAGSCSVAEALEQFRAGKLTPAQSADVEGHWA